jgi:hypothetical protein
LALAVAHLDPILVNFLQVTTLLRYRYRRHPGLLPTGQHLLSFSSFAPSSLLTRSILVSITLDLHIQTPHLALSKKASEAHFLPSFHLRAPIFVRRTDDEPRYHTVAHLSEMHL